MLYAQKTFFGLLVSIPGGLFFSANRERPSRGGVALDRLQDMPAADLHQSANSYFGLLRQATHSHHDRALIAKLLRQRGRVVQGDFTKTYRKTTT